MLGLSADEQTYATRYKQGGRTVYGLSVSPAQIVGLIPRPDPKIPNPGNRRIQENHARSFAEYYLNHEDWVIPGIILRSADIFAFDSQAAIGDEHATFGVLSYPKSAASNIQIRAGQHRVLGFHIARGLIQKRIDEARDFRSRAIRQAGGDKRDAVVKEAEKQLQQARNLEERFGREHVAVEIQVTDDAQKYRQMFFDIADNAMTISASVKARFDTRKIVNRATALVGDHPLLANRIDEENDRLPQNSNDFLTLQHLSRIVHATVVGMKGRVHKTLERDGDDRQIAANAKRFFDDMIAAFPQLEALTVGQVSARVLRDTSLLGSPGMMRALAAAWHDLQESPQYQDHGKLVDYFKALNPHMAGPAHPESIWYKYVLIDRRDQRGDIIAREHAFQEWSFSPGGRRQDIQAVSDAIRDWAILGKKGAPFVWKAPAPAPELPKTLEEQVLEEQIEADPLLGELLTQQAEAPKPVRRKPSSPPKLVEIPDPAGGKHPANA
jgi:hypothetical protein